MNSRHYDYIIAGAGLSGLSLAHRLIHSPLADKKILVVDKTLSPHNNKTWSFWHKGTPPFEELIYKSWNQVKVVFSEQVILQPLKTYTYHSIRSGDLSRSILQELEAHPSVDLLEAPVNSMQGSDTEATLETPDDRYSASYIFQSCLTPPALKKDQPCYPLIQHFLGGEIAASEEVFDPSTITLMDFDLSFSGGIGFIYILPQSPQKALLEYTIFSEEVKPKEFYEEKLAIYIHNKYNLRPLDYEIESTEYGEILMQDHRYVPWYASRIINMGAVGGLTKPSTGYAFSRIQNHVDACVKRLVEEGKPALPYRSPFRYRAYDLWLLQILHDHPQQGLEIFWQLFSNNSMDEIFRFLAEENTLLQDFKTINKLSYPPFFRAMWKTKKRLFEI